jgi:transmembrane sensor
MMVDFPPQDDSPALEREAIAWLVRVTDEGAGAADQAALQRWQMTSPAHARAFAKVSSIWQAFPSAIAAAVDSGDVALPRPAAARAVIGRRQLLVGFSSAAAAAAAYAMVEPPFGLWPSIFELSADYRTALGQQRRINISAAVSLEMNTQTSITLRPTTDQIKSLEIIGGEAIINAAGGGTPVQVIAADGRTTAEAADFDIRCATRTTSVTCLRGAVRVQHRAQTVTLAANQQVFYGDGKVSAAVEVDPAVVTAWRDGYLIFRKEPLAHVVAEVNRYRPGRIVLLDSALGQNLVTARFKLDRLDDVIAQIREVFGAKVRTLPGGLVLVG